MNDVIQQLEDAAKAQKTAPVVTKTLSKTGRRAKMLAIIGGAALIIGTSASAAYNHFRDRISTDDAQVDAHVAPIASKVFGNVSAILVDDNQVVKAGQVLVRM